MAVGPGHWKRGRLLPPGGTVWNVSCPARASCWAIGDEWPMQIPVGGWPIVGFAAATADTQGRWHSATLPPTVEGTEAISCPSTSTCFAVAWTTSLVMLEYEK
jgi:hypothetical protein